MITKFEKQEVNEKEEVSFKEVEAKDADYIHYCGHDTNPPTPCKRVRK